MLTFFKIMLFFFSHTHYYYSFKCLAIILKFRRCKCCTVTLINTQYGLVESSKVTLLLVVESLLALELLGGSSVNSECSDSLSLASTSVTSN